MHRIAAYLLGYILVLLTNLPVKAKVPVLLFPITAPTRTQVKFCTEKFLRKGIGNSVIDISFLKVKLNTEFAI